MNRLDGCIVLVTGAGRGIEAAIALRYAREGATAAVADLDETNAHAVAEQVRSFGRAADALAVDVRDPAQTEAMIARVVNRFGRLDVLVNNAGVIRVRSLLDTTPEDWDFIQSVNARGLFFALQAGARRYFGSRLLARVVRAARSSTSHRSPAAEAARCWALTPRAKRPRSILPRLPRWSLRRN